LKSARLVAPRRWELLDEPIPQPTQGTMLVHLQRTAICGTDKPAWIGLGGTYPMEPGRSGHEGMGTVIACPSGKYAEGESVLLYGFDRGLFQEYTLANDDGGCIRLPAGDPDELLMSQLFGTVLHAFYKLGNIIGQDVVVIGQGSVGQLFNAALRNLGARHIIGVDPLAHRRALAPRMGATHTLAPGDGLREQVLAITGDLPHMVVEAVGLEATFHTAASLVRRGGTILYFGVPNKEEGRGVMELNFLQMFSNEARIVTTVGPNPHTDYAVALQWITEGRIDVRPMISHVLPHEQIQQAFEMVFEEPAANESLKVVLHFD
jgi:threonine dehydrogenase-like Zn-dependent dehydrogenase